MVEEKVEIIKEEKLVEVEKRESKEVENDDDDDDNDDHPDNDDEDDDIHADDDAEDDVGEEEMREKKSESEAEDALPKADNSKPKRTKEEEEARKKKYASYPMRDIKEPHANDVMFGRGGGTNHHPGNKIYRKTVEDRKLDYVNSKRLDKPLVALSIIKEWRDQSPPGRFLKADEKSGMWHDVGDKKAREKTSQALREKAPEIRKKIEEEAMIKAGKDPSEIKVADVEKKGTRFSEGTKNQQRDQVKHAVLARDHSLGREYLARDEIIPLVDDFTWDPGLMDRNPSYGSVGAYPPGRGPSYGSHGAVPPQFPPSRVPSYTSGTYEQHVPPHSGEYYQSMSQDQRHHSYGSSRYDSWSRFPSGGSVPPPPPMPSYYENSRDPYLSDRYMQSPPLSRDHSLSYNPLTNASVSHSVPPTAFDSRSGSGHWAPPNLPPPPTTHPHGVPPQAYGGHRYRSGEDSYYECNQSGSYESLNTTRPAPPPKSTVPPFSSHKPYEIDPIIAKSWSNNSEDFDVAASIFNDEETRRSWSGDDNRGNDRQPSSPANRSQMQDGVARPDIVKRMTSNQNEDFETKRDYMGDGGSIKRAALNRDNSMASNRLKEAYAPNALRKPQTLDNDMRSLSISMEQSSLESKPKPLSQDERMTTLDMTTLEMLTKPKPVSAKGRTNTIDELAIDLDDDDLLYPIDVVGKPPHLRITGRLSTAEYFDIVNEPLGED